jgi:uncharacterized protein
MLIGGGNTFDVICTNVKNASKYFRIDVRVNVEHYALYAIDQVTSLFQDCENVKVYGSATQYSGEDSENTCKTINMLFKRNTNKHMLKHPPMGLRPCTAESSRGLTVMPNGDYYKCWHQIGTNTPAGNIVTGEENAKILSEWIGWNRFDDKECSECKYLPLCNMKCPATTLLSEHYHINCKMTLKKAHRRALLEATDMQENGDNCDNSKKSG